MATFYAARSEIITPLPWLTFALPFSVIQYTEILRKVQEVYYVNSRVIELLSDRAEKAAVVIPIDL